MEHWKSALLAVVAGMMLSGCVSSMSTSDMQSYHSADQDIHAVFSNGNDYRSPIKPWFFGY
jgi:hypothetical protein